MRLARLVSLALPVLTILGDAACSSSPDAGAPHSSSDDGGDAGPAGPTCDVHASAAPSTFTEGTDKWNLGPSGINAQATHLLAADLDGDGYPDVVATTLGGNYFNSPPSKASSPKTVLVLMNRPGPKGGRIFVDATDASGIFDARGGSSTQYRAAELNIAADVDNDGDLDLFSGKYNDPSNAQGDFGARSEVLLNDGHGHFTLAPASDPHTKDPRPTTSASFVDVDRDGKVDLFVAFWYPNYGDNVGEPYGMQHELYHGNGDGTFTEITSQVGLKTLTSSWEQDKTSKPAYGVQACDLDGDGAPELLVAAYGRQWNLLYKNDGTGHFAEVGRTSGYAGDSITDWHDNQVYRCYCTLHASEAACAGAKLPSLQCPSPADSDWITGFDDMPWLLNGLSYTTSCADLDGDGDLDLYSGTIRHWWAGLSEDPSQMLRNDTGSDGKITFTRISQQDSGMVWPHPSASWNEGALGTVAGDLDNDGRQDVLVGGTAYAGNYSLIFHQKPDHTFEEVSQPWGVHNPCSDGLVVADFDRDGDLDVLTGSGTGGNCENNATVAQLRLYENGASQNGHWLTVRLVGDGMTSNRAGIGARVTVKVGGESLVQEVSGGYGYYDEQNDTPLFFGVGACGSVDSVSVRWPDSSATVETFPNVATNRFVELRRGDSQVYDVSLAH